MIQLIQPMARFPLTNPRNAAAQPDAVAALDRGGECCGMDAEKASS
jgi:hypothetical protein